MNHSYLVLLVIVLISGTAAAITVGPFLDFDEPVEPAGFYWHWDTEFTNIWGDTIKDSITISCSAPVHVHGLAYVTLGALGFEDDALVTTIYGKALDPAVPGLETTGFNPLSPEITPISGETIFGASGTAYQSFFATGPTALSSLPFLFPDLDLSSFQGDPLSVVYAFQTSMPASEIPEPATMTLLVIVGSFAMLRRKRQRA